MTHIGQAMVQLTRNTYTLFSKERNTFISIGRYGVIELTSNTKFKYIYNSAAAQLAITTCIATYAQWGLITALIKQVYVGLFRGFIQRLELHGLGFKSSLHS